jgi:hypothetical protein
MLGFRADHPRKRGMLQLPLLDFSAFSTQPILAASG